MYDRNNLAKPTNLDHSKVTRYNFAFFQTNAIGDIWGTDDYADPILLYGEMDWSWVAGQGERGIVRGLSLACRHCVRDTITRLV